jgi:FkbM family methyltransferase
VRDLKEYGVAYTVHTVFADVGLVSSYPTSTLLMRYSEHGKRCIVRHIREHVKNWENFISPNGDIIKISDEQIMQLKNGIKMFVRPSPSRNWDIMAIYETMLRQDYGVVRPDELVIDVGAYIGDFSIFAAHLGGVVYAFEPAPESFQQLIRNAKLNGVAVKAFNVAIVPSEYAYKKARLLYQNNWGATKVNSYSLSSGVDCMSLKKVFVNEGITKVDLLKMDVEGLEYHILMDLEDDIYAKIERIVLEFHGGCSKRLERLRRKLESKGFFVETVIPFYSREQGLLRCSR